MESCQKAKSPELRLFRRIRNFCIQFRKEVTLQIGGQTTSSLVWNAVRFSTWLFVTHVSNFQKPGDYRTLDAFGFSIIVILGKDKQLRAFHNVCRHRAYPVTKKESGSSIVLGCRYHGWSYNTKGKLIKAPEFDNVPGFEKNLNGLWEVRSKMRQGMLFVNLHAGPNVEDLDLVESEPMLKNWRVSEMREIAEWKVEGAFNWKLLGQLLCDNKWKIQPRWPRIFSIGPPKYWKELGNFKTAHIRQLASGNLLIVKAIPKSPLTTVIECTVLAKYPANSRAEKEEVKRKIDSEVEQLSLKQQKLLVGQAQDFLDGSIIAEQDNIDAILKVHSDLESKLASEINPAARIQHLSDEGKADDDFCRELEDGKDSICAANSKGLLDW